MSLTREALAAVLADIQKHCSNMLAQDREHRRHHQDWLTFVEMIWWLCNDTLEEHGGSDDCERLCRP